MAVRDKTDFLEFRKPWRWLLIVPSFLALSLFGQPAVGWQGNRTLVFVVDSSERMSEYLSGAKGVILTYADQSNEGDYVGIVSSSKTSRTLMSKRISGPRDKESAGMMLDAMTVAGEFADVAGGIARALEETATLKRKGDKNVKGIVVISASEAVDEKSGAETLAKALNDISRFVNDDEWYIQYCYLGGRRDRQIENFVSSAGGFSYDINALQSKNGTETLAELYRIISSPEELCHVSVRDLKNTVMAKEPAGSDWAPLKPGMPVQEQMRLRTANESRGVLTVGSFGTLGLDPDAELTLLSMRNDPLRHQALIHVSLKSGSVWAHFVEKPESSLRVSMEGAGLRVAGESAVVTRTPETGNLRVTSFSDSILVSAMGEGAQTVTLAANQATYMGGGRMLAPAEVAEPCMIEEWKSWRKALVGGSSLAALDFAIPEVVFPHKLIKIGPIKSGASQSATYTIQVLGMADASKVKMAVDTSIDLPDGLSLSTGVTDGDRPDRKVLTLNVDGSQSFKVTGNPTFEGLLKIEPAPDSMVVFKTIPVQLAITAKGPLLPKYVIVILIAALLGVGCAVGAGFVLRAKKVDHPKPHRVTGRLIVLKDPTGGNIGTVNLDEISTKSSRLSLVVGSSRTADVRLKHSSVSHDHSTLEAYLTGGRLMTYIEPVGSAKLIVNGEVLRSKTCLNDGAKIEIGEFVYQFEDTQLYKKVDVVYKNGRQLNGILDIAGMDAEGFKMSPNDAVSPSERARVKFSDVRSVTFHRRLVDVLAHKLRPTAKTDSMKRVELMFKKGSTISGYVQREYSEGRHRYVELLPLELDSNIDYTVVDYSFVVEKKAI